MRKIKAAYIEPNDYFPEEIRKEYKLGEFAESDELYKIKSVMLGHAIGDALGVPVEFCDREELAEHPVTDMTGYGTYPVPAGAWSDDTSMSLCALDSLCHKDWKWNDIMNNFVDWLEKGKYTPTGETFDVGRTCLKAIVSYCRGDADAVNCGKNSEHSNGNGSLMRIHPFVLYAAFAMMNGGDEDYFKWLAVIKRASSLTHAHDRSVMGCYIYGHCLTFLLEEQSKESLKKGIDFAKKSLDYLPEFHHYDRIFDSDFANLPASEIKSSGYVVDTLEAALWCVLTTDNYRDCVLKAVNLGEDTDTVAAVAGGLAGALYGYDAIPKEWLDTLMRREHIEGMCEAAARGWGK